MNNGFRTTQDMVQELRISRRTLYKWIAAGKVHPVRIGGQWRFSQEELNRIKVQGI